MNEKLAGFCETQATESIPAQRADTESLAIILAAGKINVSGAHQSELEQPSLDLVLRNLPALAHPSKSGLMFGLYNRDTNQLCAIRKIYGLAPDAEIARPDGQPPTSPGHSYLMTAKMALDTVSDIEKYQLQLELVGLNVPKLLDVKSEPVSAGGVYEPARYNVSFDQKFVDGSNFEDLFKLACQTENFPAMQLLVASSLEMLKKLINYSVGLSSGVFNVLPRSNELPLGFDFKPDNLVINFDNPAEPTLWFIDIFAPGNRHPQNSACFIHRFIDQSEGDRAWSNYHERLISKSGIYSKLILELGGVIFATNIPRTLKEFYFNQVADLIAKFIQEFDPDSFEDFNRERIIQFSAYLKIAGRAELRRFKPIDLADNYQPAEHILPPASEWPEITLILGPCRTGTTALQRALLANGEPSFYQPLKHLRRNADVGIQTEWRVPSASEMPKIVIKETLGPYTASEIFDPIADLLAAGCPKTKIKVLGIFRDPATTFQSWLKTFELSPASKDLFFKAWEQAKEILDLLVDNGIEHLVVAQEQLHADSRQVLQTICHFLNIPFLPEMLDWKNDFSGNKILEPVLEPDWYAARFKDPSGTGQANPIATTSNAERFFVPKREVKNLADAQQELVQIYELFNLWTLET